MFEQFTRNRVLVYLKKNADYGDSFVNSINALGETRQTPVFFWGGDAREHPGGLLRLDPAFAYAEPPSS